MNSTNTPEPYTANTDAIDNIDFTSIMEALGKLNMLSTQVLEDVIDELQNEIDRRPAVKHDPTVHSYYGSCELCEGVCHADYVKEQSVEEMCREESAAIDRQEHIFTKLSPA